MVRNYGNPSALAVNFGRIGPVEEPWRRRCWAVRPRAYSVLMLGAEFLEHAAVNLYFSPAVLERDVAKLRDGGYHVVRADASGWLCVADMHRDLLRMFDFPSYYGQNWAALDDCLGDVRDREYGFPAARHPDW